MLIKLIIIKLVKFIIVVVLAYIYANTIKWLAIVIIIWLIKAVSSNIILEFSSARVKIIKNSRRRFAYQQTQPKIAHNKYLKTITWSEKCEDLCISSKNLAN